jgi:hypothetical protein
MRTGSDALHWLLLVATRCNEPNLHFWFKATQSPFVSAELPRHVLVEAEKIDSQGLLAGLFSRQVLSPSIGLCFRLCLGADVRFSAMIVSHGRSWPKADERQLSASEGRADVTLRQR